MTSRKNTRRSDLTVVFVSTASLIIAEYNPRIITPWEFAQIRESIEKYGFVQPLIVNSLSARKNTVIGGHQRLQVAKALHILDVPVVYIELDYDRERQLNIRLNKNRAHKLNTDKLSSHFSTEELLSYGFTAKELDILFGLNPPTDESVNKNRQAAKPSFGLNFKSLEDQQSFVTYVTSLSLKNPQQSIASLITDKMEASCG